MKGELVKTVTSDGLELAGFFIDKKSDVAVFHSHGTSGDFYTHKFIETEGKKFSSIGISFLTANNRGHDVYADIRVDKKDKVEWTQIGGGFEKFEDCLLDIEAWLDFLTKRGVKKVILQAHSLTQKVLYYQASKKDKRVIGQIHLSPCNDAGFVSLKIGKKKYDTINRKVKAMIRSGKGNELLPKELYVVCPMSAIAYYGYLTEEGPGNIFPYHNPSSPKWKILEKTKESLLVTYGGDDFFIKSSIQDKNIQSVAKLFKAKARSAKSVEAKIIPGSSHSYVGYEEELTTIIYRWVHKLCFY